ncbi:MAG: glycosyltransferase [Deltaproteobacteria bacterium]|nr:glycosyltransferase [Deltaproteobacteria bacterium]
MFNLEDMATAGFIYSAFCFAVAVILIVVQNFWGRGEDLFRKLAYLKVNLVAALGTWLLTQQTWEAVILMSLGLAISVASHYLLRNFTIAGRLLMATNLLLMMFGLLWGTWFISTIDVSTITRVLMFSGYPLLILSLFPGLVSTFEQWEVLCRKTWLRPRAPLPPGQLKHYPKVSLHVPAYSEPPDMVIETLNTIANLRYPNFEVLVIDNNTKDANLWKPVEEHCHRLGERFRFFHVDSLSGAKAGAVNFALRHTAPDAEIIGVLDSDYLPEPDFLERLVGYFDDPKIGFVQTPHDYREWENSTYQRMCYWEYKYFFETTMPSLNERDTALTVGTMCLIRRKALEDAGGWAEWCATEDSELSIRIHALGYSSVYTNVTFGRGLIPETFSGYKKQRFRWTFGPVQELKRHFRLYLPRFLARPSALSTLQKIHHMNHGLGYLNIGLGFLLIPFGIATVISMLLHGEAVDIPNTLWITSSMALASGLALWWLAYRVFLKCSLKDTIGALIASRALNHTYNMASIQGLFIPQIPWKRTNKFKSLPLGLGALTSVQTELSIGAAMLLFVGVALSFFPQTGLHLMLLIGILLRSLDYFAAPVMAILAENDVRAQQSQGKFVKKAVAGGMTQVINSSDSYDFSIFRKPDLAHRLGGNEQAYPE